jgi:hypothetical protein
MPISTNPDLREVPTEENVVTPWEESPLKTIWREVAEGRYPSVETVQRMMTSSSSEKSIGELLVQRRSRR